MTKRAVQTMLVTVLIAVLFFPQQGYAFFRGTGGLSAHVTSGSGMLFYLNVLPGTAAQLENGVQPAVTGTNRNLSINLGRKKAGAGALLGVNLPSLFQIENKTSSILTTLVTIENGSSPNPAKGGINSFVGIFNLNLSIVKGSSSAVGITVTPGTGMPAGVYTGFIVISAGILLPTETMRIPVTVELY